MDDPVQPRDLGADDRSGLLRYLARRQRARERQRVLSFAFNGSSGAYGHFELVLLREANDLAPTRYAAKGAALCTSGRARVAAWAMGRETG